MIKNRSKKFIILSAVILTAVSMLHGGEPGTRAGNFLKLPVGGRASAMGGAVIALPDGACSAYWNPAALMLDMPQAALMHNSLVEKVSHQHAFYAHPFDFGTLALGISYVSAGKIEGYDAFGEKTGSVDYYDLAASLSYQRHISSDVSSGATIKLIQSKLEDESATGVAADIGAMYRLRDTDFLFGAVIRNLGSKMKYIKEGYSLPLSFDLGAGYSTRIMGEEVNAGLVGVIPFDNNFFIKVGMEAVLQELVSVRMGYDGSYDIGNGLNFGLGLAVKNFQIDYGLKLSGTMGQGHTVSVSFDFIGLN